MMGTWSAYTVFRKPASTELLPLEYHLAAEPAPIYTPVALPNAAITGRIHIIRGQKVILDRDLAELYGVGTKQLKRQVRRDPGRFPEEPMFALTTEEAENSKSQYGTLKHRENITCLPMAFTEQGVAMLSSVLNSEQAILVVLPAEHARKPIGFKPHAP